MLGLATGQFLPAAVPGQAQSIAPVREAMLPPPEAGPHRMVHAADVLNVVDGDTFEARVHVWPGLDITTKVRLRSIDAPEMRAGCPQEAQRAEAARAALSAILAEGEVGISRVGHDRYGGRVLADASTRRTADIGQALLAAGVARPYGGGRRAGWCGG